MEREGKGGEVLDDDFLFYSHLYSSITVLFAMGVLSKFLTNHFRFGFRSFLTLVVLFLGEPVCHLLLRGPSGVVIFGIGCVIVYRILPGRHLPVTGKTILITGCDSGFGHAIASKLDSLGAVVYAGCLSNSGPGATQLRAACSDRLRIIQLDVTDSVQICEAVELVSKSVGEKGLWGLVNNAGLCYIGELEMMSETIFRKILEVNLFGMIRVTKAFLPLVRRARGRVINMSSVTGHVSFECFGAYGVSKFGIEAYSDVLRLEMKKWGVKVCTIQPAGFSTASMELETIVSRREEVWETLDEMARSAYGREYFDQIFSNFSSCVPLYPTDLAPVVRVIRAALFACDPSERYPVGRGAGLLLGAFPLLPVSVADRLSRLLSVAAVSNIRPASMARNVEATDD